MATLNEEVPVQIEDSTKEQAPSTESEIVSVPADAPISMDSSETVAEKEPEVQPKSLAKADEPVPVDLVKSGESTHVVEPENPVKVDEPAPLEPADNVKAEEPAPIEAVNLVKPEEPAPIEAVNLVKPEEPAPIEAVNLVKPEEPAPIEAVNLVKPEEPAPIEAENLVKPEEPVPVEPTNLAKVDEPVPMEEEPSTSSGQDEVLKTAINALFQGKRHLLVKDLPHAIASLGEACRLLGEVKGSVSLDSGDAHYYYGKALLELARSELAVIDAPGGAQSGEEDDEEVDEEEGEEEDEEEGDEVNGESTEDKKEEVAAEAPAEAAEAEEDISAPSPKIATDAELPAAPITNGSSSSSGTNGVKEDNEKPSTSAGLGQTELEAEIDDEPSNLELAWEVLEVAKITYIALLEKAHLSEAGALNEGPRKTEKELKELRERLASTHLLLGEVATENEAYGPAEEDFMTALNIFRDIESPDSRKIGHSYFLLGVAYSFDKKFVEAISSFEKAAELIELRISNLKTLIANKESEEYKALDEPEQEIEELELLLPEMKEKIGDTKDAQAETLKTQQEDKQEQEIILRNSPIKNPNPAPANDISHLVKKKKKADDELDLEPPRKKVCGDAVDGDVSMTEEPQPDAAAAPATNGNSNGNGHAVSEEAAAVVQQ